MAPAILRKHFASILVSSALLLSGCINNRSERGVEPLWQDQDEDAFIVEETTRAEVLQRLGPPSQIITLGGGSAYYYLFERSHSRGVILLFYNSRNEKTVYDRAVFFFDADGILTDYATR